MLDRILAALSLAALVAMAAPATADSVAFSIAHPYPVVGGTLETPGEAPMAFSGEFFLGVPCLLCFLPLGDDLEYIQIAYFELEAGDQIFEPRLPVWPSFFIDPQSSNHIQISGEQVISGLFQANTELVEASENEQTYRYLEFRITGDDVTGDAPFSSLPRRLSLEGKLDEVFETYPVSSDICPSQRFPFRLPVLLPGVSPRDEGATAPGTAPETAPPVASASPVNRDFFSPGGVVYDDDGEIDFDPPPPVIIRYPCLIPVPVSEERNEIGSFTLVLSAAQQVDARVYPRRVNPFRRGSVWAVLYGSEDFDVDDIDRDSLRFGSGEAEPSSFFGRRAILSVDIDRDGKRDLIARFKVRDAEIAIGDTEACTIGETSEAVSFEGCSEIDTRPWVWWER